MFAVVCIVVCIIVCVIEVQCVHRRVHHVRSLCALSCGPVILVHLVDGSSCNTYHQHAYVSPITPLGPRAPGALGPWAPGSLAPGSQGPWALGPDVNAEEAPLHVYIHTLPLLPKPYVSPSP